MNLPGYPTRPENPGFLTFGGLGFLASKPGYPRVSNFYNLELKNAWNGRKFEPIAILYVLSYVRFHLLSTDANLIKLRPQFSIIWKVGVFYGRLIYGFIDVSGHSQFSSEVWKHFKLNKSIQKAICKHWQEKYQLWHQ